MGKLKFSVSPEIKLDIVVEDVSGDLRISGWERDEIGGDGDRVTVRQADDGHVVVRCAGDCRLSVPARASIKIHNIAGDARITGIEGEAVLDNVAGDLIIRDVGPVRLPNVSADLRVKRVDGDLDVNNVGADATIREVTGDVRIQHVGADLYVRDVAGGCTVDHVGSDMVLNMAFAPGHVYRFNAGSDVVCRVPVDTNARFIIVAPQEVRIDEDMASVVSEEGDQQIVTFGAGDAEVYINAGSEVRLVSQPDDTESGFRFGVVSPELDLDFEFSLDLEEKMADVERILSDKLAGLDERLRSTIESQAAKAEREAERLRRRAEKQAERLQRAAERRAKRFHVTWGTPPEPPRPPSPPTPPTDPVSDEERMMILRMVENKQISVEEAERLLAALEGRAK